MPLCATSAPPQGLQNAISMNLSAIVKRYWGAVSTANGNSSGGHAQRHSSQPRQCRTGGTSRLQAFFETLQNCPALARVILFEIFGVSKKMDALYYQAMEDFAALLGELAQVLGIARIVPPASDACSTPA